MSDYEKCGGALWERKKKQYAKCIRCGRVLKQADAQERGYGKICWQKHLIDKQTTLF